MHLCNFDPLSEEVARLPHFQYKSKPKVAGTSFLKLITSPKGQGGYGVKEYVVSSVSPLVNVTHDPRVMLPSIVLILRPQCL